MATRICSPSDIAVLVDISNGEQLRYSVSFRGARAVFTLVNKQGTILLSQTSAPGLAGPWALLWPGSTPPITLPGEFTHTIGFHFLAAAEYSYKVTKEDSAGATIAVVKDCRYLSNVANDVFFEPLSVFVK